MSNPSPCSLLGLSNWFKLNLYPYLFFIKSLVYRTRDHYRPHTIMWEGHVFNHVCLSVHRRGSPDEYVSLQLRVQNWRRKWHFPLNFQNGIIWTSPFLPNIRNTINWAGATSKAFSSSEALISVLSKNACLYDNTVHCTNIQWSRLDTNLWIWNLCICQKTCQQNTNIW